MHSDQARASVFAKRYCDAKMMAAGKDSVDLLEMLPFVRDPSKHDSFGVTKDWKAAVGQVPRDLEKADFERWLWRENV